MSRMTPAFQRWLTCLLAVTMLGLLPGWSAADDPRTDTSLRFIPDDAAFYASMLNNGKQLDALRNSNLFQTLTSNPAVQLGLMQLQEMMADPGEDYAEIVDFFRVPENKEIFDLLGDSVSQEVFVYGGGGYTEMLSAFQTVYGDIQKKQLDAIANGADPNAAVQKALGDYLVKLDRMPIGELVIGFKVKDTERAQRQLARLEELANLAAENVPELAGKFKRDKVGKADLLSLTLDGSMVPWDDQPLQELKDAGVDQDVIDEIVKKLKKAKLVLSLGTFDDYILLSVAPNNDHLANFGKVKLLIDRPELKGLSHANGRPLTSISYISDALLKSSQSVDEQIDSTAKSFTQLIDTAGVPAEISGQIKSDITDIFNDLKKFTPEPGAVFGYAFMTKDGYEGYGYNWSENIFLDGSKPLTILNHVGGDPIAFVASRTKSAEETYQLLKKIATRTVFYVDSFGVEQMDEESRKIYELVREEALPLLRRLDDVTTNLLLPSVRDGQSAVVIDAQLVKNKWHEAMPTAEIPLPFPEIGYVMGLSSADQFKQAVSGYIEIGRDAIGKIREVTPEGIPPFEVPPPMVRSYDFGDIYFYQIPPEVGLNKLIAPNAGISDDTLTLTMLPRQTKRLLESKPPRVGNDLISMDKPLASAVHFNFERLLKAIEPWVYYAVEEGSKEDLEGQLKDLTEDFGGGLGLGGGDFEAAPEFEIPGDLEEPEQDSENEPRKDDDGDEADGDDAVEEFGVEDTEGEPTEGEPTEGEPTEGEPTEEELEEKEEQRKFTVQLINQQVKEVFKVLRCFKSFTAVTYMEDDATVTRMKWQFQDLPAE
ncbi:MAG: hypothetical protein ACI9HK_001031 [Pirellulaceae bacterium]|jgi:hypothetical protein